MCIIKDHLIKKVIGVGKLWNRIYEFCGDHQVCTVILDEVFVFV